MKETEKMLLDELHYYFVVQHDLPDGKCAFSLSSYAPFRDDRTTLPFDSEMDAALYLLDEFGKGGIVSSNDVETAKAIIRGDKPMFVYEEKQPDGTLLLSLHGCLPPEGSKIIARCLGASVEQVDQQNYLRDFSWGDCMKANAFRPPKKRYARLNP